MSNAIVTKTIQDHIGIITLNYPEKCNAINPELIYLFQEHFHALHDDKKVSAIVINGNGKHFCAGADIRQMQKMTEASESENARDAQWLMQLFDMIHQSEKTTLCYAHGHTFGGGLGILAACDIVIAAPSAKFCFPEVKIGIIPATIAPFVTQRIGYQAAKYHMLTATPFDVQTALAIRLVDQLDDKNNGLETALATAQQITQNDANALAVTKQWLNTLHPLEKNLSNQAPKLLAEIRTSNGAKQRITDFLASRK